MFSLAWIRFVDLTTNELSAEVSIRAQGLLDIAVREIEVEFLRYYPSTPPPPPPPTPTSKPNPPIQTASRHSVGKTTRPKPGATYQERLNYALMDDDDSDSEEDSDRETTQVAETASNQVPSLSPAPPSSKLEQTVDELEKSLKHLEVGKDSLTSKSKKQKKRKGRK